MEFSPDELAVVSISLDGTIELWDAQFEQKAGMLEDLSGYISVVVISPDRQKWR